jgi:hypothetical protein
MIAVLGAAAALAGLILVFLGILISAIESFPTDTRTALLDPYRRYAAAILGTFLLSIAAVVLALIWLVEGGSADLLYKAAIVAFLVDCVALVASAGLVSWRLVFRR